jgi:hypothetical protein
MYYKENTMAKYDGILFFGQSFEFAGRGIAGPRLRTAAMKAGYNVLTTDITNDITIDEILNIIGTNISYKTKFVGFSTSWIDFDNLKHHKWCNKEFFLTIKERWPGLTIITGGHDEWDKSVILNHTNFHFHGFSDNSFVEFLKKINKDKTANFPSYRNPLYKGHIIDSNNTLPVLDPDEIETIFELDDDFQSHQPLPIEISRGCIFRCGFCRHPFQGKKDYDSYQRSPESIARELSRNYDLFGTTRYTIVDDTFNDSIEKILRVQKAIKIANLPKFECVAYIKPELLVTKPDMIHMLGDIGLRGAFLGIESMNNKSRRSVGKGTDIGKVMDAITKLSDYNDRQILCHASFIVGLPHDTPEMINSTFEFLTSPDNTQFRSWVFHTLGLRSVSNTSLPGADSTIDKDPGKYGYRINSGTNQWFGEFFNYMTASAMSKKLTIDSRFLMKSGGWRIAGLWHLGFTDNEINENNISFLEIFDRLKSLSAVRATSEYKRLTGG